MKLFSKLFANKKQENNQKILKKEKQMLKQEKENETPEDENDAVTVKGLSLTISSDENYGISISSSDVGVATGSTAVDFYVHEWFTKDTGEIFYVGKRRGDRYKTFHERAYEAEKIYEMYDTDTRFVGTGLTEEQAVALESKEMTRILDETKDLLSMNGNRVLKTQFAKSVTAWIYIGDDYVMNYEIDQEKGLEKLGRNIPTYHLLDVRKFLIERYGEVKTVSKEKISISPLHNRVPLKDINNLHIWKKDSIKECHIGNKVIGNEKMAT